jgi:hypothetical protein
MTSRLCYTYISDWTLENIASPFDQLNLKKD